MKTQRLALVGAVLGSFLWWSPLAAQNVQSNGVTQDLSSPIAGDLDLWMRYRDGEGTFAELTDFLTARPTWPGLDRIRARAETELPPDLPPQDIIAFFEDADVQTGQGAVAYGQALIANGEGAAAEAMLTEIWLNDALDEDGHQAMINAFPDLLAPHHVARADMLLWRWRTSDAAKMLPLIDEGHQALARARIALITSASDAANREALVPDRLRGDAGLHYDRFNRLSDRGDWTLAMGILLDRSTSAESLGQPWRWGSWRRILARWQMREGNIDRAYTLATSHFIAPDDDSYADLEWLAGYLALTYQQDYPRALMHFERFDVAVSSPISKGRAGYWLGRTHEAMGSADAATAAYRAGATHQTSFYGLLSAEKLGLSLDPALAGGEVFGDWRSAPLLSNELVRAGLHLLAAGERGLAVLFFRDAAAGMTRQEIGLLGSMFMDINEPFYAVLVAKTAVQDDTLVQDVYFPIHPMAQMDLPVEPALALAIARQESEFRVDAGSSVGALGLMQLMPGTAQDVAGWLDLPFDRARLTSDWAYNATLGSEYLAYLTREFGSSPVMIAAGYNAGPTRPRSWIAERGDPRRGFGNATPVDVIDWIEHIPFRETRNYVMRVTEGIPIYRARLTGDVGPVRFTDLLIGELPIVRPELRPTSQSAGQAPRPVARTTD